MHVLSSHMQVGAAIVRI